MTSDVTISETAPIYGSFRLQASYMSRVKITLMGGAQAKTFLASSWSGNVGNYHSFRRNYIIEDRNYFQTGGSMNGRAVAQTAVILDKISLQNSIIIRGDRRLFLGVPVAFLPFI